MIFQGNIEKPWERENWCVPGACTKWQVMEWIRGWPLLIEFWLAIGRSNHQLSEGLWLRRRDLVASTSSYSSRVVLVLVCVLFGLGIVSHFCYCGKCHCHWEDQDLQDCTGYLRGSRRFEGLGLVFWSHLWELTSAVSFLFLRRLHLT